MRSLTEVDFKGWPAYALQQGRLTLHLVPAVGGRLMGIRFDEHELCFIHPDLEGKTFDGSPAAWEHLRGDWDFPLRGGGKTWVAPESRWPDGIPHTDLDSFAWQITKAWIDDTSIGITLLSPICTRTGLQISRALQLSAHDSEWTIRHVLRNRGEQAVRCGIWDVLMLKHPAEAMIPLAVVPEPVIALPGHPETDTLVREGKLALVENAAYVQCKQPGQFKCGFASTEGLVQVDFTDWGLRYERRSEVPAWSEHAHGRPLEVFNAPRLPYFEVETHSPAAILEAGESIRYDIAERVCVPE